MLVSVEDTCQGMMSRPCRLQVGPLLDQTSSREHGGGSKQRDGIMCDDWADIGQGLPAPQSNSTHEVCLAKGATSSRVNGASLRLFAIEIRPNRSKSAHSRADHGTKPNERLQGHPKDFLVVAHR
jgi:hypothetical protein